MGRMDDYVEVNERIVEFREQYPEGSLQAEIVASPFEGFLVVKAYAFRKPDDHRPGTGLAWEPVPGLTNFTRNSELMNAETSAWGRAIIAVLAADAKRGIASANEVRNRQAESEQGKAARVVTEELGGEELITDGQRKYLMKLLRDNGVDDEARKRLLTELKVPEGSTTHMPKALATVTIEALESDERRPNVLKMAGVQ